MKKAQSSLLFLLMCCNGKAALALFDNYDIKYQYKEIIGGHSFVFAAGFWLLSFL